MREALREPHRTDANGELQLALFHGDYRAEVHAGALETSFEFRVPATGPAEVLIRLPIGGGSARIQGRVTELGSGIPLGASEVYCFLVDEPPEIDSRQHCKTDADGRYEFDDAPIGELAIVAYDRSTDQRTLTRGSTSRRKLARRGDDLDLDFARAPCDPGTDPTRTVAVAVRVLDADSGLPIQRASVDIEGDHLGAELSLCWSTADALGQWTGRIARVESYRLTVDPPWLMSHDSGLKYERARLDLWPIDGAIEATVRLPRQR